MTAVKPWSWPAYRAHQRVPNDEPGIREYHVEALLRLGSIDGGEPDTAITLLHRLVRPDMTRDDVDEHARELVQMANDTSDFEVTGERQALDIAADVYAAALYDFANSGPR